MRRHNDQESAFRRDYRCVLTTGFWVAMGVSSIMLGVPAMLSMTLKVPAGSTQLGAGDLAILWHVYLLTAPLATAVAVITIGFLRGWFDNAGVLWVPAIIIAGALLGNLLGHGAAPVQPRQLLESNNGIVAYTLTKGLNYLAGFYVAYGLSLFLSAVVVGVFLGWSWNRFLPHLRRPLQASKDKDVSDKAGQSRRRAA